MKPDPALSFFMRDTEDLLLCLTVLVVYGNNIVDTVTVMECFVLTGLTTVFHIQK